VAEPVALALLQKITADKGAQLEQGRVEVPVERGGRVVRIVVGHVPEPCRPRVVRKVALP
jgi:hypothetical protein